MKKDGIFEPFTRCLKDSAIPDEHLRMYKHFSFGGFSKDLLKFRLHDEDIRYTLDRIGIAHRAEVLNAL